MANNTSVGELLKTVDAFIKSGRLQEASVQIDRVIQVESKNVYIRAYQERIAELLKALPQEPTQKNPPSPVDSTKKIETVETLKPPVPNAVSVPSSSPVQTRKLTSAITLAYKTLLHEIWKDGTLTAEERQRLQNMREVLGISREEHDQIEKVVRISAFLSIVKLQWLRGNKNFSVIQKQFNFSDAEAKEVAPKLEKLLAALNANATILVLDDDANFLLFISKALEKNNYHCLTTQSAEEGLELLQTMTPDIILCDIAFGKSQMNGFEFYEQLRTIHKFYRTPFIFLSALTQESLIRTGKKLGIDDYLTKPIDYERLLATIEGKLRRANEMRDEA